MEVGQGPNWGCSANGKKRDKYNFYRGDYEEFWRLGYKAVYCGEIQLTSGRI
jgi:hypothetical protein